VVSRAVRTPSRGEDGVTLLLPSVGVVPVPFPPGTLPIFPLLLGNPDLLSEELIAYEAGVRAQPTDAFSWDLAVFFNDYQRVSVPVPGSPFFGPPGAFFIPMPLRNAMAGDTYGFELATTYKVSERWRLQSAYTFLIMDLRPVAGSSVDQETEGSSPRNMLYVQSSWDLGHRWELDMIGRYVDSLPSFRVPQYIVGDIRLAWHARRNLELSVVGRNLFNGSFRQFGNDSFMGTRSTAVQPEGYGQVVWRY